MATKKFKYVPTKFMAKTSHYDKRKADKAVLFIESLKHTDGIWNDKPFKLLPWQEQIVRDIFGIVKKDGYRQFNTAYVEIPKKNGKSELAAAIALYLTIGDHEKSAQVFSCAADTQQAALVYNVAVKMIEKSKSLSKRIKTRESYKMVTYTDLQGDKSIYRVLSADSSTKHGLNVHGVVFDELHAQPNRKLYDVMTKGSGDARKQPLFFLITTAGDDLNSIGFEVHQKAKDILEGRKKDSTFYPVIYGAEMDDDWTDPEVWKKSNPSLGVTVTIDKVEAACESAIQNPSEENAFRQLRLNQWVKQEKRWMPMREWDGCFKEYDEDFLKGRPCYGGLDLSSTMDVTAFVLVFPPTEDDDKYYILPYFWIPGDNVSKRVARDHVQYDEWTRRGYINTTEGNVIHYEYIEKFIDKLGEKFNIKEIAFDRWGALHMTQNLENMGFNVVAFGQGFRDMSPPTKELMTLVMGRKLVQNGNPVMHWMMDNIHIHQDAAGNIKMDKAKSIEKIDGAVALVMGLDRALRCGNKETESVYDNRGLIFI